MAVQRKSRFIHQVEVEADTIFLLHTLTFDKFLLRGSDKVAWDDDNLPGIRQSVLKDLNARKFLNTDEGECALFDRFCDIFCNLKTDIVPTAYIYMTTDCNLNCSYCFQSEWVDGDKPQDISEKQIGYILDALPNFMNNDTSNDIGLHVVIFGGEPLLPRNKQKLRLLLTGLRGLNVTTEVVTNGIALKSFTDILNEFDDVLTTFRLTLNGPSYLHDEIKGCGFKTYRTIIDSIIYLLEKTSVYVTVNILLTKTNMHSISDVISELCEFGIYENPRIDVIFGRIQFRDIHTYTHYKDELDYADYYPLLITAVRNDDRLTINHLTGTEVAFLGKIYRGWSNRSLVTPSLKGCKAVSVGHFCFFTDGLIYPCTQLTKDSKYAIGRYQPELTFNEKRDSWTGYSPLKLEKCSNCKYIGMCDGACPATNLLVSDDINNVQCKMVAESIDKFIRHVYQEDGDFS